VIYLTAGSDRLPGESPVGAGVSRPRQQPSFTFFRYYEPINEMQQGHRAHARAVTSL
jgi:hypothetical protein